MHSVAESKNLLFGCLGYPEGRDSILLPTPLEWLFFKRQIDMTILKSNVSNNLDDSLRTKESQHENGSVRNLWRIHNAVYDFSSFEHPGGHELLFMTKNTDVTELFESSHLDIEKVRRIISHYKVRDCSSKELRFSSYLTFKEDGFYSVLRRRVFEFLKKDNCGANAYFNSTCWIHDILLISFLSLLVAAVSKIAFDLHCGYILPSLAGSVLALLANCSHNFFHQKDNWRMYSFDLTANSSFEWRISHVYSHHCFPNTIYDYEISAFEPFINFLPYQSKNTFQVRFRSILLMIFLIPLAMIVTFVKRIANIISGKCSLRKENLLPIILFLFCCAVSFLCCGPSLILDVVKNVSMKFFVMYVACSTVFLNIALSAGHHHPNIWHAGDPVQSNKKFIDWGIFQLVAVGHRPSIDKSHFVSSMTFGQHILHHLFPTLDQSKLSALIPIFQKTTAEFGISYLSNAHSPRRSFSFYQGWFGMLSQIFRFVENPDTFPVEAFNSTKID